jgi:hypothetical protein
LLVKKIREGAITTPNVDNGELSSRLKDPQELPEAELLRFGRIPVDACGRSTMCSEFLRVVRCCLPFKTIAYYAQG